jgi:hypothetical protein
MPVLPQTTPRGMSPLETTHLSPFGYSSPPAPNVPAATTSIRWMRGKSSNLVEHRENPDGEPGFLLTENRVLPAYRSLRQFEE